LMTPHEEYLALGKTCDERRENYRSLFRAHLDEELVTEIRKSVNTGLVLGSERFKDEVESNLKRRVRPGVAGRPKKSESAEEIRVSSKNLRSKFYSDPISQNQRGGDDAQSDLVDVAGERLE